METTTLNVECPRCGKTHEAELHRYAQGGTRIPWTHWYLCSETGEPASIRLDAEQAVEVDERCLRALIEAQQAGQYMFAVWHIRAGQLFRPFWLTSSFPKADIKVAIESLTKDVASESMDVLPSANLQAALPPQRMPMQVRGPTLASQTVDAIADPSPLGNGVVRPVEVIDPAVAEALQPCHVDVLPPSVPMQLDNAPAKELVAADERRD